ncbi:MAG: preprotein translocase subunit SecG [Syntrophothermus sp.]|nr:preprotein translocase subunit SecG [Ignavibacteriaceae bacterium]
MYTLLVFLTTIIAVLLIIMVLLQSSKGGGLAGTFGGAGMGTMFGSRRTADFLSKATWWLGGSLAVLTLVINLFFLPSRLTPQQQDEINRRQQQEQQQQQQQAPQQQAPQQQTPGRQ